MEDSLAGNCLVRGAVSQQGGQTSEITVEYAVSSEALRTALQLSAAGQYRTGIWHADGSASFYASQESDRTSQYIVIDVQRSLGSAQLDDPTLAPNRAALLQRDPASFLTACGNHFVAERRMGGRVRIVLRLERARNRTVRQLAATLRVAASAGSVSASVSQQVEQTAESFHGQLYYLQQGARQPIAIPMDIPAAINRANSFLQTLNMGNATAIAITTRSYAVASNFPPGGRLANYVYVRDTVLGRRLAARERLRAFSDRLAQLAESISRSPSCDNAAEVERALEEQATVLQTAYLRASEQLATLSLGVAPNFRDELLPRLAVPSAAREAMTRARACIPPCPGGHARDQLGYCTRCSSNLFQVDSASTGQQHALFTCPDMYPGVRASAQYTGGIVPYRNGNPAPFQNWTAQIDLTVGDTRRSFGGEQNLLGMDVHYNLSNEGVPFTGPSTGDGSVSVAASVGRCFVMGTSAGGGHSPCSLTARWVIGEL